MTKVLIAGLGNMGLPHALAHHRHAGAQIVALVTLSGKTAHKKLQEYPIYSNFYRALQETKPDLVVIATHSDTHADFAIAAMKSGAHVFVEKPLAMTVNEAKNIVSNAVRCQKKLVVGYILRHHPSWIRLIKEARALGGPYVFRLNLNQQSTDQAWRTHKQIMKTTSPIVDCGLHYVDVMCQITDAVPLRVQAMGLRLSDEIDPDMYNYGQLQLIFADGSVGWYEVGWGPMISETAFFVKDIISPNGAVSIIHNEKIESDDVDGHTKVGQILLHRQQGDLTIETPNEPNHDALCAIEQAFVLKAISEDIDLSSHMQDAVQSLAICLAADESIRLGQPVSLEGKLS